MRWTPFLFGLAALLITLETDAAVVVVTPDNLGSWQLGPGLICTPFPGSVDFVMGPGTPPLGTGSMQLDAGPQSALVVMQSTAINGIAIAAVTSLRYSTYVSSSVLPAKAPRLLLIIETDEPALPFDQIQFDPALQVQGPVVNGTWQSWNAFAGGWQSLSGPPAPLTSLASYAALHPTARVSSLVGTGGGLVILEGCDGSRIRASVDALEVGTAANTTVFDFELVSPVPLFETWMLALLGVAVLSIGLWRAR